ENWYWDERQQRLIIRLERFAPLVERLEFQGYRRTGFSAWNRPLFYRRKK
ncbi:MAG: hypothetical protein IT260_16515, partial [Saprospiraceae bacterium]|nr:hypothetical protein [Saprospiraceae bacterium]